MKLLKIVREEKVVEFRQEVQGHQATEERDIICKEAPLKSFDDALAALSDVVLNIMGLPRNWEEEITIKSMAVSYTKKGTRSVQITFDKFYSSVEKTKGEKTPFFQIDNAADGEDGRMQCAKKHSGLVVTMIAEAEKYASGERQQQLLPLDKPDDANEPAKGDQMDFAKDGDKDWSQTSIPFYADTNIPEFSRMETQHALWYIDNHQDSKDLKSEIQYNFNEVVHHKTGLDKMKIKAKELLCKS